MPSTALAVVDPTPAAIKDEQDYLLAVREIRNLAERIDSVEDAKVLADKAAAAQIWARRAKLGAVQENLAAAAKLWAEYRAGELLSFLHGSTSGRAKVLPENVSHRESHEFQKLAEIPREEFQAALDTATAEGAVTRSRVMAVHYSSATDLWETPQDLFALLDAEFGFELDVCATVDNAKCGRFFTEDDDGLAQDWTGVCWMNPPYGEAIAAWVEKAHRAGNSGATVVCLVPARVDTAWFWEHCRYGEVRLIRGRLKFGGGKNSAPFPSAVVIFGREPDVKWWEAWPT